MGLVLLMFIGIGSPRWFLGGGFPFFRFHREADPVTFFIDLRDRYHYLLLNFNQFVGVFHIAVSQLAKVYQPVLVYADVYEGAEVGDIGDDTR